MGSNMLIVTVKHPKGEDEYRTFSVRLRESMVSQMDEISKETGRSRNELIGLFLAYALEHCKLEGVDDDAQPKQV